MSDANQNLLTRAVEALEKDVVDRKKSMFERCPDCDYPNQCSRESGCKVIKDDYYSPHQKLIDEMKAELEKKIAAPVISLKKVKVEIIESESGWGQRIDEVIEFDSKEKAEEFCRAYNSKHNPPREETPKWYMYARLEGELFNMLR